MFPPESPTPGFPYRVEAKIGEGAMGIVYRATEPELGRRVAIKVLKPQALADAPELADDLRRRFAQEARAAAALSHPGVTTIYRVGEEDGTPYIAMEWIEGRTLEEILEAEGTLAPERAASVGCALLEALDAAHRAGVVHRDVKPSNVILLPGDRLKVTDFGIARMHGSEIVKTQPGLILATPQFASPEQLHGGDIDGRCDVFSAAVLLYLAVSGRYPFEGRNILELVTSIAHKDPTPLGHHVPGVDPGLERAIHRALEKRPEDRYASAAEMADALRPHAVGPNAVGPRTVVPPAPAVRADATRATAPDVLGTAATRIGSVETADAAATYADAAETFYAATRPGLDYPAAGTSPSTPPTAAGPHAEPPRSEVAPPAPETRANAPRARDVGPAPETVRSAPAPYPTLVDAPDAPHDVVARVVATWPARALGRVPVASIVDRLLERPLHAEAFAGAVELDGRCLLVADGFVVGAVREGSDATSDEVCESLPAEAEATLRTPPPGAAAAALVTVLASLLHAPAVRLADIDSSIVNLAALSEKLAAEKFDGLLRLARGEASGYVFFAGGGAALSAFSAGWEGLPVDQSWESWASRVPLRASLEERSWNPAFLSFRRELRGAEFFAQPSGDAGSGRLTSGLKVLQRLGRSPGAAPTAWRVTPVARAGSPAAEAGREALVAQDPIYRFLRWGLEELPGYFRERERSNRWKYLGEWLHLVRKASLHCELPRPDSRETDYFDMATFDADGKVLHLAERVAKGSPESLRAFLDRVVAAKTARIKTGDVGGAFLIAPSFEASTVEAYAAATRPEVATRTMFGMEERLTGYEGFVRIGPRRGFHLLLVAETPGGFEPVLLT